MVDGDSRVGHVLASKYRLEELLGSGGMGHVYRATNELVGRAVAIKLLRPEHAANGEVVARFMREAIAANLVRHPNVVDVVDVGKDADGSPFIVQELLTGQDLSRYATEKGRLSLEEVVDLLCPVIDAIALAHQQGVVHRDIKPENVFLARDAGGRLVPKLLDFGISKVRSSLGRGTEVGVMMGTPAYMPPEQLQGARDADARSDVWALGVMLFELLSGRLPFLANQAPALFIAIATEDAPKLSEVCPDIPPAVSTIVERCLRRKPDERYPTAAELARDLRLMTEGQELEPTGKRSVPPEWKGVVPELRIPASALAPTMVPDLALPAPAPRAVQQPKPPGIVAKEPEAPPKPKPRPRPAPILEADLPGVMMGTAVSAVSQRRPAQPEWAAIDAAPPPPDMSWVVGLCIVTLIAIAVVGALMSVAHRPDGWDFASRVLPDSGALVVLGQAAAALVAAIAGGNYGRRAFRHWNGDLGGGRSSAVIQAVVAGALFFAAIELVRGAW